MKFSEIFYVVYFYKKPEGKMPLGGPRRRWRKKLRWIFLEIGLESVEWIHVAQDRDRWWALVNTVMNPRVP
jgi:hypothetical protein